MARYRAKCPTCRRTIESGRCIGCGRNDYSKSKDEIYFICNHCGAYGPGIACPNDGTPIPTQYLYKVGWF